ncbi:hypothetical protein KI387_022292, partial [Taxus chinensis]
GMGGKSVDAQECLTEVPGKPQSVVSEEALHEIYANTIGEICDAKNAPTACTSAVIVRDDLPTSK